MLFTHDVPPVSDGVVSWPTNKVPPHPEENLSSRASLHVVDAQGHDRKLAMP